MLLIFDEATELYSETVSNEYGHGATAGKQQLKWWITEESDGFKGLIFPGNAGRDAENDRSNLDFSDDEVNENQGGVMAQIQTWREERTSWIIAAAIQTRCCALEIICVNDGRQIEALIDAGFDQDNRRWNESDFIGACVLLRGCARSLLEILARAGKFKKEDKWKETLGTFLPFNSNNVARNGFILKHHAAVRSLTLVMITRRQANVGSSL